MDAAADLSVNRRVRHLEELPTALLHVLGKLLGPCMADDPLIAQGHIVGDAQLLIFGRNLQHLPVLDLLGQIGPQSAFLAGQKAFVQHAHDTVDVIAQAAVEVDGFDLFFIILLGNPASVTITMFKPSARSDIHSRWHLFNYISSTTN